MYCLELPFFLLKDTAEIFPKTKTRYTARETIHLFSVKTTVKNFSTLIKYIRRSL